MRLDKIMRKITFLATISLMLVFMTTIADAATVGLTTTFLNQDPDPAEPGKYVELRWKVNKMGNEKVENLTFMLEPEYPFSFDGTDKPVKVVGDWLGTTQDDQYYILYYKLKVDKAAVEDTYTLKLKSRDKQDRTWTSSEFDVRVGESQIPRFALGQLLTSPQKLVADTEEAELDVELQNIGKGSSENTLVQLILPEGIEPTFAYSDRENLGIIDAGSSKTADFFIDISEDINGGLYDAMLNVSYKESDEQEYMNTMIPLKLPIKEQAKFDIVDVETMPDEVRPGKDVDVKIKLKNIGGDEADSVSIRAFKDSSQPFDFDEKSDFIGKLKPGDVGEAILTLSIDEDAKPKTHIIDIEIRAIDGEDVLVHDKSFNFPILEQSGFGSGEQGNIFLMIVVGAIFGLGGFVLGRKKIKKR